ncbi:hypothetical protein [Pedobacter helvus]|uniref:YtxH domain-containing protein n=1 Tax=Pedobacter helvus TaxID=2563444 RepID=A0ABW9JJQ3_9SPHI|nr:hypothetical protein [Pedobacter ureilyticus]
MREGLFVSRNKTAAVIIIGVAATAGVALVYSAPKTRAICRRLLGNVIKMLKGNTVSCKQQVENKGWENDLANAEKLKGEVKKRKVPAIKVASASTNAWKED